jgi:hypothetical protein
MSLIRPFGEDFLKGEKGFAGILKATKLKEKVN